ncbi:hypothetical protein PC123_g23010 [Phytophthora cactorum]|nr:hypothetical protein PC123_g23010 [Phytophthora cactorum]
MDVKVLAAVVLSRKNAWRNPVCKLRDGEVHEWSMKIMLDFELAEHASAELLPMHVFTRIYLLSVSPCQGRRGKLPEGSLGRRVLEREHGLCVLDKFFPATESSETLEANHPSNEPRVLTPTAILSELRGTENRIETAKKVLVMTEERRACVLRQELAHHPDVFRDIKLQVRENVPSPGESSTRQRVGAISLDPKVQGEDAPTNLMARGRVCEIVEHQERRRVPPAGLYDVIAARRRTGWTARPRVGPRRATEMDGVSWNGTEGALKVPGEFSKERHG